MRRSLDAPQRPSQPSQRDDLLFLFFAQDIAHVTERNSPPVQCPDSAISLAGFQVSTHGRFWVSPEAIGFVYHSTEFSRQPFQDEIVRIVSATD
jgi:hypothetical protein